MNAQGLTQPAPWHARLRLHSDTALGIRSGRDVRVRDCMAAAGLGRVDSSRFLSVFALFCLFIRNLS